jgi:hypothetical protein
MLRKPAVALLLISACSISTRGQQASGLAGLKTTAESSDFKSTSTYDDVVKFMKTVDEASPTVFVATYGKTFEGRAMPLAIVGTGLKTGAPAEVRATGKLRVHIQANIHAGEVEGKESALILLRELALGRHQDWLSSTVFLITPIFNADGNEKFALNNRGRQNGPINGEGTRANGQNLNINRDFMKLDTPEALAFVKLWNDYDPEVGFDLHTSDGSTHGYFLTYSPPLNPNTSGTIMSIMKNEWFPFVTKTVKTDHGWDTFYYGNAALPGGRGGRRGAAPTPDIVGGQPAPAAMRAWATFEHVPRFHNNYVGLRNRFALLSEAYAYATFEDRIKATNFFLEAALRFAHQNAARLKRAVADADRESIIGKPAATRAQMARGGTVEILMGEVEPEKNPINGAEMNRRKDIVKPETMIDMMWFEPALTEDVASEYFVPAAATRAMELLRAHGVQMRRAPLPASGLEQFQITANTTRPATGSIDTGAHALRTLQGEWTPLAGSAGPGDYWAVSMAQPLARLAFYLLAPTSDDGLTNWNALDDLLTGPTYPILRRR